MPTFCFEHRTTETEYFCKQCKIAVCTKCTFEKHNGHILTDKNPTAAPELENPHGIEYPEAVQHGVHAKTTLQ
jgi:hypothetical protein